MAQGKQIIFYLKQIQTNDGEETYSETYHFKPANEDLKKHVTLKISGGTDVKERLDKLGLPSGKMDSIVLEFGVKEVQSKLIQPEEKPEKEDEE